MLIDTKKHRPIRLQKKKKKNVKPRSDKKLQQQNNASLVRTLPLFERTDGM